MEDNSDHHGEVPGDDNDNASDKTYVTPRNQPIKNKKRYGIQQSLLKRSVKYEPARVEQPKSARARLLTLLQRTET